MVFLRACIRLKPTSVQPYDDGQRGIELRLVGGVGLIEDAFFIGVGWVDYEFGDFPIPSEIDVPLQHLHR